MEATTTRKPHHNLKGCLQDLRSATRRKEFDEISLLCNWPFKTIGNLLPVFSTMCKLIKHQDLVLLKNIIFTTSSPKKKTKLKDSYSSDTSDATYSSKCLSSSYCCVNISSFFSLPLNQFNNNDIPFKISLINVMYSLYKSEES